MNHFNFASKAHKIRQKLSVHIANDIVTEAPVRSQIIEKVKHLPAQTCHPGIDKPQSDKNNLDNFRRGILAGSMFRSATGSIC